MFRSHVDGPLSFLHRRRAIRPGPGGSIDQIGNMLLPQHVAAEHNLCVLDSNSAIDDGVAEDCRGQQLAAEGRDKGLIFVTHI
jgi:hypothetical protein